MVFVRTLCFLLTVLFARVYAADLSYSTYLKSGFTPKAIAADTDGNLYIAGTALTDPLSGGTAAAVAKLGAGAHEFVYLVYLDSAAADDIAAIAVDGAGDAYVTGTTRNPRFPATGGKLATPPAGPPDSRPFVTRLDPSGGIAFSVRLGGATASTGAAIALTPQGRILVSGVSIGSGFPSTAGAYAVDDSAYRPFLLELDPTASTAVFSATGIGGSSLALDSSGNIYVSGSTTLLDYPTTPGAYQTTFTPAFVCTGLCQLAFAGEQQYLSKLDASGSRLLYSTGINGPAYRSASTRNTGLAVDAGGNAYITGILDGGPYPFTVSPPAASPYETGYLTKVDAAGAHVLYSIPLGGGGVSIDPAGKVVAAGTVTSYNPSASPQPAPIRVADALAWVPSQCLPDNVGTYSEGYIVQLDPASDRCWIRNGSTALR